jgi:hypothetical protein
MERLRRQGLTRAGSSGGALEGHHRILSPSRLLSSLLQGIGLLFRLSCAVEQYQELSGHSGALAVSGSPS